MTDEQRQPMSAITRKQNPTPLSPRNPLKLSKNHLIYNIGNNDVFV